MGAEPETEAPPVTTPDVMVDTIAAFDSLSADTTLQGAAPGGPGVAAMPPVYLVVDGIELEEVTPTMYQGRSGFRAVQRLESGDELTIESYFLGADTAGIGPIGRIQIFPTAGDTVLGIVRTPSHLVYASGVLPQDSLRRLLGRLVEREQ